MLLQNIYLMYVLNINCKMQKGSNNVYCKLINIK